MDEATVKPDTKAKITSTALELFANQGYHKTSISQIAKKVNVSKSLIYNYFDSKHHLLEYIVEDAFHRSVIHLPVPHWEDLDTIDHLLEYMKNMIEDLKSNPAYYRLLILLTLQGGVKEKIMEGIMGQKEKFFPLLQTIFQKHQVQEPEKMMYFFGALFDGLVLHYLYMQDEYPLVPLFDYFIEQFKTLLNPQTALP